MGFWSSLKRDFNNAITFGAANQLEDAKSDLQSRESVLREVHSDFLDQRQKAFNSLEYEAHTKVVSIELLKEIKERLLDLKAHNQFIYNFTFSDLRGVHPNSVKLSPGVIFSNAFTGMAYTAELGLHISNDINAINTIYHKTFASHASTKGSALTGKSIAAKHAALATHSKTSMVFTSKALGAKLVTGKAVGTAIVGKTALAGGAAAAGKVALAGTLGVVALPLVAVSGIFFQNFNVREKLKLTNEAIATTNNEISRFRGYSIKCIEVQNKSAQNVKYVLNIQTNIENAYFNFEQVAITIFNSLEFWPRFWAKICLFFSFPNENLLELRKARKQMNAQIKLLIDFVKNK